MSCSLASLPLLLSTTSVILSPKTVQEEWIELFDGRSLTGWVTTGGRYDGHAAWAVEDGEIVGRQGPNRAGGLLYTADEYADFELELETDVSYPFDSGIFLRMTPRTEDTKGAQVTLDYRDGGEIGGIYSDGYWLHNPDGEARFERGAWNRFKVRCTGQPMHVEVWMNGEPLTDYRFPEAAEGFARTGKIGLQVHGARDDEGRVKFRNVRVRRLDSKTVDYFEPGKNGLVTLTKKGSAAGWRQLFNGKDLDGWEAVGSGKGFEVRDGVLTFLKEGDSPYLRTKEDFEDFHLRLDFKIARTANSGLFLRGDRAGGDPAYSGCEVQILDDFNFEADTGYELKPWQFCGSLYAAVAPGVKALHPIGEWNTYEVHYWGKRLVVTLNGKVLYDVDTHALDAKPLFADRVQKGFIGMQRHAPEQLTGDAYAWFRNVFVREL